MRWLTSACYVARSARVPTSRATYEWTTPASRTGLQCVTNGASSLSSVSQAAASRDLAHSAYAARAARTPCRPDIRQRHADFPLGGACPLVVLSMRCSWRAEHAV